MDPVQLPVTEVFKMHPEDIIVENRERVDLGDLSGLAKSMQLKGQIHPIVIDTANKLVVGRRRLAAALEAKMPFIHCVRKGGPEVTPLLLAELELDENLHRKDFTPDELATSRAKIRILDELRGKWAARKEASTQGEISPGKQVSKPLPLKPTIAETARKIGIDDQTLKQDILIMGILEVYPDLREETKKSAILAKAKRRRIEAITQELARRNADRTSDSVQCGDCIILLTDVPDESVHLILTDIPYGIKVSELSSADWGNTDHRHQSTYFEDGQDQESALALIEAIVDDLYRVLIPGGRIFFTLLHQQFEPLVRLFEEAKFNVRPMPMIWDKGNGFNTAPLRDITCTWEPIFCAAKGAPRNLTRAVTDDILAYPVPQNKRHVNEKPVELGQHIIDIASYPGELILDPFCGSGAFLEAGVRLGRRVLGIDKNQVCCDMAIARITGVTPHAITST